MASYELIYVLWAGQKSRPGMQFLRYICNAMSQEASPTRKASM